MSAWSKVERAKFLLQSLEDEIKSFLNSSPYEVNFRVDEKRGGIYFLSKCNEVPASINLITGDIVQNLRSSLDHSIFEHFLKTSPTGVKEKNVYFPIKDSKLAYNEKDFQKSILWMSHSLRAELENIQPYKDGNTKLWQLHTLNNIDKHRILVTTGSAFRSVDIAAHLFQLMKMSISFGPVILNSADATIPVKKGAELFVDLPARAPNPDIKFQFDICLYEPSIGLTDALLSILREIIKPTEETIIRVEKLI